MELKNQLKSLADKIHQLKDKIQTEESTKHAFVLPFINTVKKKKKKTIIIINIKSI